MCKSHPHPGRKWNFLTFWVVIILHNCKLDPIGDLYEVANKIILAKESFSVNAWMYEITCFFES